MIDERRETIDELVQSRKHRNDTPVLPWQSVQIPTGQDVGAKRKEREHKSPASILDAIRTQQIHNVTYISIRKIFRFRPTSFVRLLAKSQVCGREECC